MKLKWNQSSTQQDMDSCMALKLADYIHPAGRDSKKAIAGKQETCFVTDPALNAL